MINYLLKVLYLTIVSFVVLFTYYIFYNFHGESATWYTWYIASISAIYLIYKSYTIYNNKEKIKFSLASIFLYFLLHLFILSVLFFVFNEQSWIYWISLFFIIIAYLLLPTLIVTSSISFWKFILKYIKWFSEESSIFQFLLSLWFWFFSFVTLLSISWFLWFYNLYAVFWILILFLWLSYKEFISILKSFYTYTIEFDNHKLDGNVFENINLKLLSTELLFIIITFLISVNLINIVRPMPIWWDDLWVYMNFPQLLANAWEIIPLWWMLSWQIFTWIWYMFKSASQAFFLNNVWWILSVIVIVLSFKDLLSSKVKTFLNIPLLMWAVFISMPMVIFQQAKDMKLDPGLFFISAIVVYLVIYLFLKYLEDKKQDIFSNKNYLIYLFLVWVLAWFAFSIKLTSLILISWIIWVIAFSKLWLSGFFAYIVAYIWIFTKFWFWSMLNVVYPKENIDLTNKVFLWSVVLTLWLLAYSFYKHKALAFKRFFIIFFVFLIWVLASLSPWFARNIYTLKWENISITWILNWKAESFQADYSKIYTKEELDEMDKKQQSTSMDNSWTSLNEDLWRYFWYETWINNYIKLPYNLTMQENQRWEYTDITYIFLAFVPVIILFLWFSSVWASIWYFIMSLVPFLFFFWSKINAIIWINLIPDISSYLTNVFSSLSLPFWYVFIALEFVIPIVYLIYFLDDEKTSKIFKLNLIFTSFYTFLWSISAFWIVWYWVTMYYWFLLILALWLKQVSSYSYDEEFKITTFKFFGSLITFLLIIFYFFNSSYPHWFNNIKNASYVSFKSWTVKPYTSIFNSHENYFRVLFELNISPDKKTDFLNYLKKDIKNEKLLAVFKDINDLSNYQWALRELSNIPEEQAKNMSPIEYKTILNEARELENNLYYNILYPKDEFKNNLWIYRIWTFLKYFVNNNNVRLFEDGLIFQFDEKFYDDKDINIWIERMKKLWLSYFLVDLNAATIDKDPRRALTKRYEELLKTFTSDKLELVDTDSLCLKFAIDVYSKSPKSDTDLNNYMMTAWVNYESYDENWNLTFARYDKQKYCYNKMLEYIQENKVSEKDYSYLLWIKNYISQNKIDSEDQLAKFFTTYVSYGWMTLFRIK